MESTLSKVAQALTPEQRLWYRCSVNVPQEWQGQRVLVGYASGFLEGQNEQPGDKAEPLRHSLGKEQVELGDAGINY